MTQANQAEQLALRKELQRLAGERDRCKTAFARVCSDNDQLRAALATRDHQIARLQAQLKRLQGD